MIRMRLSVAALAISTVPKRMCSSRSGDGKSDDAINLMQKSWNLAVDIGISGVDRIGPNPCTKPVVLDAVRKKIELEKYIQKPNCCLFEVARIIDDCHGGDSFLDIKGLPDGLTSRLGKSCNLPLHPDARDFVVRHKQGIHSDDLIDTKSFVKNYLNHTVLSGAYISARELQDHFQETGRPVYSFCQWGVSEDKAGYSNHVILVLGVDTSGRILYYDVSDKLDTSRFSRFREMDIEEYNQLRISLGASVFFRNHIFFRE